MATVHAPFPAAANAFSGSSSTVPASLYVGDLHPSVTEGTLYNAFAEFKSLSSVRLCKDASTGRSLCYGYANFLSRQDAYHAIEKKNHSMLNGKMIRVMWSVRESDARKNGVGNVFVKNLPESVNNAGLQGMFKTFGDIVSCKIATFEDGKSRGYGFVQFEQEDAAHAAIEKLNGTIVADKEIYVGKFMRKTERGKPEEKYTNLYMKNLDSNVSEVSLREKFSEFGKIVSLAIAKDEKGLCKGYAFVNFENPEDARCAAETMNGTQYGSKKLYVGRAQKKSEREQLLKEQFEEKRKEQKTTAKVSNIYVKNINVDVTEEELRKHFSQCGTITSAKLMCDEKGNSKGFGFVCFSAPEEAIDAVKTFHGQMFHGKPLYVAIAQKKEDRQMQLQVQFGKSVSAAGGSTSSPSVIPGTYPSVYYTNTHPGMVYPSYAPNLINSAYPNFQVVTYPPVVANAPRNNKQNRNEQLDSNAVSYVPHVYQSTQMLPLSRDTSNEQMERNRSYGRGKDMKKLNQQRQADTIGREKQMIGEKLYPHVEKIKPQLAKKITGMLLEMDKPELLILLKSPEDLAGKVHEAVEVLKSSKTNLTSPNTLRSDYLATGVSGLSIN
ncbi:PREDICTED: polyadenylate-binding protein 7-like isoform X1 [Camelina sativa]|uniref:Polyadenylate-binding protein n=1 Tax=Camelina sativa TaxID=90675 RepID=A0ABM0YSF6_CAMSA|nr:PREDICTED: polyadenylate-binding protein 7-like isoform X1 [Camelina sativa]